MLNKRATERIQLLNAPQSSLIDLSEGGACCMVAHKGERDDALTVVLDGLHLKARVVFARESSDAFRTGVQFYALSDDTLEQLRKMIDHFSRGVSVSCTVTPEHAQ
jgi:hypothetical protein